MPSEHLTDRPSSRVLNAPGGASSMASIFGGAAAEPVAKKAAPSAPPAANVHQPAAGGRVVNRSEYTVHNAPSTRVHAAPGGNSSMGGIFGTSAPTTTPAPQPNTTPIAPIAAATQLAAGQRVVNRTEHAGIEAGASTRVLSAPGGASSVAGLLGGNAEDRKAALQARRAAHLADATNVAAA